MSYRLGGPAGSGVQFLVQVGASAQALTGPEFDILSFDPRGKLFFLYSSSSAKVCTSTIS